MMDVCSRGSKSAQFAIASACFLALAFSCALPGHAAETFLDRSRTGNFDSGWRFHLGDVPAASQASYNDSAWRQVDVPHDFSAEGEFSPTNASATGFLPGGVGWYRKDFRVPEDWRGERVAIEFEGVQRDSDVWINGVHLGHRPSGYMGFQYDLTPHLRFGEKMTNLVSVRVERSNVADSRWYPGTGIYRHVWLRHSGFLHIAPWGVSIRTPRITSEAADIVTITEVTNESDRPGTIQVVNTVLDPEGATVGQVSSSDTVEPGKTRSFSDWQKVGWPKLWSPDRPALYTLQTRVVEGNTILEEVRTRFGIRSFWFDANRGFFLNGARLVLKGICMHHDAGALGAAVPDRVLERRLRLAKNIGVNAIRCSHNPMAPGLYDLCDRIGLLVMDEAFDEWEIGKRKWVEGRNRGTAERFGYAEAFSEWGERDLSDMVRQHRNHPSIILWSIGNEIDYPTDPYVHPESRVDPDFKDFPIEGHPSVTRLAVIAPRLIAAVKRQDPTRPVTMALANVPAANATGLAALLEVAGYNYQERHYEKDHHMFPGRVLFGSENGKSFEAWSAVKTNEYISGLFLWTGFDFLGEAGAWPSHGSMAGLFDTCGFIKPIGLQFEALWKDSPVLHLVAAESQAADGWRRRSPGLPAWNGTPGRTMKVTAFSNCREVDLLLNGRSLGPRQPGPECALEWVVPFEPGELVALGRTQSGQVVKDRLVTSGTPARLQLIADRTDLQATGADVVQIEIRAVDQHEILVPDAALECSVSVTGPARLAAVDNGDLFDPAPLRSAVRKLRHGRALAVIASQARAGSVHIMVRAPGLPQQQLELEVK